MDSREYMRPDGHCKVCGWFHCRCAPAEAVEGLDGPRHKTALDGEYEKALDIINGQRERIEVLTAELAALRPTGWRDLGREDVFRAMRYDPSTHEWRGRDAEFHAAGITPLPAPQDTEGR